MDAGGPPPWWKTAVLYQIYPRSFALGDPSGRQARLGTAGVPYDALRDGVGDLEGIRRKLDYLAGLGIDALWISPFQPSPMADFGYDVADYCAVAPLFGTLDDFDRLLTDVHARGMRLIMDWVPNHTSDQHPWFVDRAARRGQQSTVTGTCGGTAAHLAGASRQTTGHGRSAKARRGPTTRARSSGTCTCFSRSSPI